MHTSVCNALLYKWSWYSVSTTNQTILSINRCNLSFATIEHSGPVKIQFLFKSFFRLSFCLGVIERLQAIVVNYKVNSFNKYSIYSYILSSNQICHQTLKVSTDWYQLQANNWPIRAWLVGYERTMARSSIIQH